jgi:hypothetical protein
MKDSLSTRLGADSRLKQYPPPNHKVGGSLKKKDAYFCKKI